MLKKKHRLSKNKDIRRVFKEGRSFRHHFMSVKYTKNNLAVSRFAFIVSNKISKKATIRNKIKRRLRASISLYLKHITFGYDIAVIMYPEAVKSDFQDIFNTLGQLLKNARLLR